MTTRFSQCLQSDGSKKILCCDGGGILGLITVEILCKIEADLRLKNGNEKMVLADFFDFVCGTSTGAIIAACISSGMSMGDIRQFYIDSGEQMFDKASLLKRLRYSYNDEPLAKKIRVELNKALHIEEGEKDAILGNENLQTLLMMVLRNHTTDSPWPVWNNPYAKYNDKARLDCNLNLPLWQLIRASTAAPTYFPPEEVTFQEGTRDEYRFIFVDGGVTTYNNPAFLAFQMATAEPYKLQWKTGVDDLLIVSVGTGNASNARPDLKKGDLWLVDHAKSIPSALMQAASCGWDMACRTLGHCRFGGKIDREFGDMVIREGGKQNWTAGKLFSYVRYDPDVTQDGLNELGLETIQSKNVQTLDSVDYIDDIRTVGNTYAEKNCSLDHMGSFV